jgi:hypothetical protein
MGRSKGGKVFKMLVDGMSLYVSILFVIVQQIYEVGNNLQEVVSTSFKTLILLLLPCTLRNQMISQNMLRV